MPKKKGKKGKKIVVYKKSKPEVKWRTRWKEKKVYVTKKTKATIAGINVKAVAVNMIPLFFGAAICKFSAKKFADGGGDREDWSWKNYAWGLGGTALAAILSSMVFGTKGKIAQNILSGGLLLFLYKLFINELVPKSQYLTSWFGQAEDIYGEDEGIYSEDDDDYYGEDDEPEPGDIYQGETPADDVAYGGDGRYRPVNEMHRIPAVAQSGVDIQPADPTYGVAVEPADPTFGVAVEPADPTFGKTLIEEYNQAYATF